MQTVKLFQVCSQLATVSALAVSLMLGQQSECLARRLLHCEALLFVMLILQARLED